MIDLQFFVILVIKMDGSSLTVYRKRKELQMFQRNLRKVSLEKTVAIY